MLFNKSCLCAAFVFGLATAALPQTTESKTPSVDPSTKLLKVKSEPNNVFKNWVNKEGSYVLTDAERKAFETLKTDDERENFIQTVWRMRDPDPDTEVNEFREEFYERLAYANEHFASGIPGWKTDRGRIYIVWGKPDSVESRPSGGSYDRPSYEGGGSTTTYPFETWFYRHLDNVGDGIEIEFVDPTGTGEYRIARGPNEKDALLHIPGAGSTLFEQLGGENRADRIAGIGQQLYQREQDSLFSRLELINNLAKVPSPKYTDLENYTRDRDGPVIDNVSLDFDLRVDFFKQSDQQVIAAFTIQTSNKNLKFERSGGMETATMNIFGRITSVSGKNTGIFEDSVTTNASTEELATLRGRKSVYQKAVALTPGTYKVAVAMRDVSTGNRGLVNMGFVVPRYDDKKLSTSSLVLTSELRASTDRDIGKPFIVGKTKIIPNLAGEYSRGQEVGVYLQVYNAIIDQTTLRPAVDVEYIITGGNREITQAEDWTGASESGQRLTLARTFSTASLTPGSYEITVRIKDRVSGQYIENKGKFSIR